MEKPAAVPLDPDIGVSPHRWWIFAGLWGAAVMEVLDTTIVNVAMPQMAGNLNATPQEIAWVATGYILSNVVVLPMTAFLAGVFGRRNYLIGSIALFILASFFCGIATSLGQMVVWRIIQGAGGAALLSTAQATLREIFPRAQQGMVQAFFMIGIVVAPTLGPTLGGWITDNYTWGWVFFVNVPLGLLAMLPVSAYLKDSPFQNPNASRRPDWLGIGLLTVGLASLQYVLEEGQKDDWFQSEFITRLAVIAGVSLIWLIFWQLSPKNKAPVIDFRVLKNHQLRTSLYLFLSLGFGLYGGLFLYPLFTQNILHLTPTATGLSLLPGGLATIVGVLICGRLLSGSIADKVDPRVLVFIGVGLFSTSMWMLGHLTTATGTDDLTFALAIRGLGLGFLFAPINQIAFAGMEPHETQQGAGLISLTRQLGGSFGIAVLGTHLSGSIKTHQNQLADHLSYGGAALGERLQGATGLLVGAGSSPADAQKAAPAIVQMLVDREAAMMAFNNGFQLILVAFLFAAPMVMLLRKPKLGGSLGGPKGH